MSSRTTNKGAHKALGDLAPKLADLTDDVHFDGIRGARAPDWRAAASQMSPKVSDEQYEASPSAPLSGQ